MSQLFARGLFDAVTAGLVPASGGGTTTFLRADGAWSGTGGGGAVVADADYGDVTVSGVGTVWTVDALPESRITGLVADLSTLSAGVAAAALATRIITTTAPLTIDGGASANLTADRTLAVSPFGVAAAGIVNLSGGSTRLLLGDNTWITQAALASALGVSPFYFGAGQDGAATFDGATAVTGCTLAAGVYTMTRHCYWSTATCTATVVLKSAGYTPHALIIVPPAIGTFVIDASGGNASGLTAGAVPWPVNSTLPNGLAGGSGSTIGSPSPAVTSTGTIRPFIAGSATAGAIGVNPGANGGKGQGGGGGGGASSAGGNGGIVTVASPTLGDWMLETTAQSAFYSGTPPGAGGAFFTVGTGGGGGGFGGAGRAGGGAGASGGWLTAKIKSITGTAANLIVRSNGGNAAAGVTSGGFDSGGGGGGSGGIVVVVLGTGVTSPTIETLGGNGAAAGGPTGGAGGNGGAGDSLVLQ